MTAFTIISNALVAVGAKPFATTIQAFRDNVLAAFEGDATAVAAGVTLRDAALNTGVATAAGTAWVSLRMAGAAVGAVGTYALLSRAGAANYAPGQTAAGSTLRYSNAGGTISGPGLISGTWMIMGMVPGVPTSQDVVSLWLRIS